MGRYNTDDEQDLLRQIAALEKRVRALESTNQIGNTGLDKGRVAVRQPDGTVVFEAGELNIGVSDAWGIATRRANNTLAFYVFSTDSGSGFWAFKDKSGNIIASEDGASGQGLATPWLPFPGWSLNSGNVPAGAEVTTSSSFVGIWNVIYRSQHPFITTDLLVRSSDGTTTGEVRIFNLSYGEQVGSTLSITGNLFDRLGITGALFVGHNEEIELEIQARRTGGAGTIGVRPMGAYGRQT